ncbi:MAG: decaprenyl-phosphate phosphoribosyltransferase [Candidatus Goldiibacteriota bacterium]
MINQAGILFSLLRVKQWIKNLLLFGAIVFTGNLFEPALFLKVTMGFFIFSFASSSLYIMNDIRDMNEDLHHPAKRHRPIAAGLVNTKTAFAMSIILLLLSLSGAYFLNLNFFYILLIYIIMTTLYTLKLKHMVILDVFVVAAGFVLRPIAGAYIINASISPWLLICASLLALFVVLSKRKYELETLEESHKHRKILSEYSVPLLNEMTSIVTASTVIAYSLYTFTSETASEHHFLMFTIPFVLYGIFRYLYLMHKKNLGGAPELIFLKDKAMIIDIFLWVLSVIIIMYFL